MMRAALRAVGASGMITLAACQGGQARVGPPAPVSTSVEWTATLAQASREARDGRFSVAEKLLSDFSSRNASIGEASEATYWRALYRLDPANPAASARESAALLDAYLASGQLSKRNEALSLRHVAGAFEAYLSSLASATAPKSEPVRVDDKAKDDEIARLKDELAKASAELDRIKRRLAQPKP